MSDTRLDTLVRGLKDAGLMGLEAVYSTYEPHEERQMRALAAKYGLLVSGGSDFHGERVKPGVELAAATSTVPTSRGLTWGQDTEGCSCRMRYWTI